MPRVERLCSRVRGRFASCSALKTWWLIGSRFEGNTSAVRLVEFAHRSGLLRANAPGGNCGAKIIFAANRRTSKTAQHGNLSHMRQRVRDRTLKELPGRRG